MDKVLQKEIAVRCLEMLDIYKPYIRKFKSEKTMPCFFENFGGFWADQEPELYGKVLDLQREYGCLVYAITHEFTEVGEMWSMLCVPSDCDEVEDILGYFNFNEYYAFAYVWNKTNDMYSEFGDVVVKSFGGGIKRVN